MKIIAIDPPASASTSARASLSPKREFREDSLAGIGQKIVRYCKL